MRKWIGTFVPTCLSFPVTDASEEGQSSSHLFTSPSFRPSIPEIVGPLQRDKVWMMMGSRTTLDGFTEE